VQISNGHMLGFTTISPLSPGEARAGGYLSMLFSSFLLTSAKSKCGVRVGKRSGKLGPSLVWFCLFSLRGKNPGTERD
jgi:hypothetical protein